MGREQRDLGDRQIKEWVALASTDLPSTFYCVASPSLQCPPARLNSSGSPGNNEKSFVRGGGQGKWDGGKGGRCVRLLPAGSSLHYCSPSGPNASSNLVHSSLPRHW